MRLYSIMKDFLTMKEYLPMEYFMKRYDVSRRTIQNDLSYLIQISSRNGYQLHMRRGNGYLLEVINDRLLDEFMKSLEHETMFDMKDRVKNMMAYLTLQESYVSMDRMAEQFQISRTSVKKDLQEVAAAGPSVAAGKEKSLRHPHPWRYTAYQKADVRAVF